MATGIEEWKEKSSDAWIDFCDKVESKGGPVGEFVSRNILKRIVVNAPVLLGFVLICTLVHVCSVIYPGLRPILGVDERFTEYWNPFSYLSLFTHVVAHENWPHLQGNMVHLLLVGPSVEASFGSKNLFYIIVLVAFSSALVHLFVGKAHTYQLGASGVVFACILLSSLVTASTGTLPLSFLIVATWWLGDEFWKFFFSGDAVSHHAHLSGGIVGTIAGYYIHKKRAEQAAKGVASKWLSGFRAAKKKE
ncbi:Peptidase, S54 family [Seminavis robusta]|uniref:Peptidase, S54 family n=1 Tax=Seminavis robusta TaxID=568900 RepID=A0A9N8F543_9STRA|nr:Peptidase, S54 family [Seminavis robusta]CAB9531811.1 Peptidase, S54 family [Seminavis robusta]|eukprot:Sro1546_g281410.1 Peptidase, S54 family (249) ;mRNA; f:14873-15619